MDTTDNDEQQMIPAQQGRALVKRSNETAIASATAQAKAAIEARYTMALHRPRDMDEVRTRFLKECARPSVADVAVYNKPIGKGVKGPSIRLAEIAMRCLTNVLSDTATLYDDDDKRIVRVIATDLESNVTYTKDVTITKVVERSSVPEGEQPISVRTNSQGRKTYTVKGTDDDILNKEGALISKALRTLVLRLFPGDILDEGLGVVYATKANTNATDPDAAKRKLVDAFARLGVSALALKEYLGHELAQSTPGEIGELREVWATLNDGEATWNEMLAHHRAQGTGGIVDPVTGEVAPALASERPTGFAGKVKAAAAADKKKTAPSTPDVVDTDAIKGPDGE